MSEWTLSPPSRKTDTDHPVPSTERFNWSSPRSNRWKQIGTSCYHTYVSRSTSSLDSPFELLYVRGPLDVLKESSETSERSCESVVLHILSVQEKLERMSEIVKENLSKAQSQQKKQTARSWRMSAKFCLQQLTSSWLSGKGRTKWTRLTSENEKMVFHINMLREYGTLPPTPLLI